MKRSIAASDSSSASKMREPQNCSYASKRLRVSDDEKSECGEGTSDDTVRGRLWCFTSSNVEKLEKEVKNWKIFIGPAEQDGGSSAAHGIIGPIGPNKSTWSAKKGTIFRLLTSQGIKLKEGYLQPLKSSKESYIKYMWKTDPSNIPETLLAWIDKRLHKPLQDKKIADLQASYDQKPSEAKWRKALIEEFGFSGVAELTVRRSYDMWPGTKNTEKQKLLKLLRERKDPIMTGMDAYGIIQEIIHNAEWSMYGHEITTKEAELVLLNAVMEATAGEVKKSPHILLEVQAGAGKTLLGQLLFPKEIASIIPNDSEGVGQMELGVDQCVVKIDDATDAFWGSSKLLGTLYTMYHNGWTAKVHSSKRDQDAAITFITSNGLSNVERFGIVADGEGATRRFMVGKFHQKFERNRKMKVTTSTVDELQIIWLWKIELRREMTKRFSRTNSIIDCNSNAKEMADDLIEMKRAMNGEEEIETGLTTNIGEVTLQNLDISDPNYGINEGENAQHWNPWDTIQRELEIDADMEEEMMKLAEQAEATKALEDIFRGETQDTFNGF